MSYLDIFWLIFLKTEMIRITILKKGEMQKLLQSSPIMIFIDCEDKSPQSIIRRTNPRLEDLSPPPNPCGFEQDFEI